MTFPVQYINSIFLLNTLGVIYRYMGCRKFNKTQIRVTLSYSNMICNYKTIVQYRRWQNLDFKFYYIAAIIILDTYTLDDAVRFQRTLLTQG